MKRMLLAGVGLIALIGAAAGTVCPRSTKLLQSAGRRAAALHVERILSRHQRRRRPRQIDWDTVGGFNVGGGLVGGTVGYNYQIQHFVLGVEGDADWSGIRGSSGGASTSDSWLSTVRGRVGYAADRFMPYITGGGAFGNVNASAPGLAGGSATNAGWTLGAGLEFAIAGNWTAKAEYLYVSLGRFNCGVGCGAATDNVSFNTNLIRGGINYRF